MVVTLYTIDCPKCKVLEMKLKQKGIDFSKVTSTEDVVKFGEKHNLKTAPILEVDGEVYDFSNAVKFINSVGA